MCRDMQASRSRSRHSSLLTSFKFEIFLDILVTLKGKFTPKMKTFHKVIHQNTSEASQQNSVAAFAYTYVVDGDQQKCIAAPA